MATGGPKPPPDPVYVFRGHDAEISSVALDNQRRTMISGFEGNGRHPLDMSD